MFKMGDIINSPTMMSTGAVAAPGMDKNSGAKNREDRKQMAVVKDVSPVRPPSATPEALSTKVVVVLVPKHAPAIVAIESAMKALFRPGMRPFGSIIPAFVHTPTSVPMVSNISMKRKVNTITTMSNENRW